MDPVVQPELEAIGDSKPNVISGSDGGDAGGKGGGMQQSSP